MDWGYIAREVLTVLAANILLLILVVIWPKLKKLCKDGKDSLDIF